jgi:hypothetical protein
MVYALISFLPDSNKGFFLCWVRLNLWFHAAHCSKFFWY